MFVLMSCGYVYTVLADICTQFCRFLPIFCAVGLVFRWAG